MYLFSRDSLNGYKNRIGGRPMMAELDKTEAWDIDTETDFTVAEMLYTAMHQMRAVA